LIDMKRIHTNFHSKQEIHLIFILTTLGLLIEILMMTLSLFSQTSLITLGQSRRKIFLEEIRNIIIGHQ